MVQQNDDKHEEAHHRIRTDHRELEVDHQALKSKVATLELLLTQQIMGLKQMETTPIDVGKIVFNPKMVLSIVGLVATVILGNYFTTTQAVSVLRAEFTGVKESVDDLKRQMEMRRLEIQQLSNNMQQLQQRGQK